MSGSTSASPAANSTNPEAERILEYWFDRGLEARKRWFSGGPTIDAEIRTQFSPLIVSARAGHLSAWQTQARSSLALILLLDQFPRNVYRATSDSFGGDPLAREVAVTSIARRFDREFEGVQPMFFYLPLLHHEDLRSQITAVALYENMMLRLEPGTEERWIAEEGMAFVESRLRVVMRFGRMPSRNGHIRTGVDAGRDRVPKGTSYGILRLCGVF